MHKGIVAYIIVLVVIVILGYFSTDGFRFAMSHSPTTVLGTTTVPPSSNVTSTTSIVPYVSGCDNYTVFESNPNSTSAVMCRWNGGRLGIWVASGLNSNVHFSIVGTNNVTYVNSTVNHDVYNCTTFYKNFSAPAQVYTLTLTTGPTGGSCDSYSLLKLNTTLVPPAETYRQVYNGNFSTGDFTGWNATGKGFANGPMNVTYADAQHCYQGDPWAGYDGDFFATTYNCGLSNSPGNLTSSQFLVDEPFLNFQVISPADQSIYVEVLSDNAPAIVAHYNTYNLTFGSTSQYTFRNATISLIKLAGKTVRVRVVAQSIKQQNYIAIGNFRLAAKPISTPGIIVNTS